MSSLAKQEAERTAKEEERKQREADAKKAPKQLAPISSAWLLDEELVEASTSLYQTIHKLTAFESQKADLEDMWSRLNDMTQAKKAMMDAMGLTTCRLKAHENVGEHGEEIKRLYTELDLRLKHLDKVGNKVLDRMLTSASKSKVAEQTTAPAESSPGRSSVMSSQAEEKLRALWTTSSEDVPSKEKGELASFIGPENIKKDLELPSGSLLRIVGEAEDQWKVIFTTTAGETKEAYVLKSHVKQRSSAGVSGWASAGPMTVLAPAEKKIEKALRNYEKYFGLPAESATLDQVQTTAAGVEGWASGESPEMKDQRLREMKAAALKAEAEKKRNAQDQLQLRLQEMKAAALKAEAEKKRNAQEALDRQVEAMRKDLGLLARGASQPRPAALKKKKKKDKEAVKAAA